MIPFYIPVFSLLDSAHTYIQEKKKKIELLEWTLFLEIKNHWISQSKWAIKGFWLLHHNSEKSLSGLWHKLLKGFLLNRARPLSQTSACPFRLIWY